MRSETISYKTMQDLLELFVLNESRDHIKKLNPDTSETVAKLLTTSKDDMDYTPNTIDKIRDLWTRLTDGSQEKASYFIYLHNFFSTVKNIHQLPENSPQKLMLLARCMLKEDSPIPLKSQKKLARWLLGALNLESNMLFIQLLDLQSQEHKNIIDLSPHHIVKFIVEQTLQSEFTTPDSYADELNQMFKQKMTSSQSLHTYEYSYYRFLQNSFSIRN